MENTDIGTMHSTLIEWYHYASYAHGSTCDLLSSKWDSRHDVFNRTWI